MTRRLRTCEGKRNNPSAIEHVITGVFLCCTIIGIPFGIVSFRLAGLALAPLGKEIVRTGQEPAGTKVVATA